MMVGVYEILVLSMMFDLEDGLWSRSKIYHWFNPLIVEPSINQDAVVAWNMN
jgi:hypothetical protein